MPINNLAAIQIKVRRLTRSPSEAQLSTTDLNNYINTFVVYDFPEHLRMFNLRTTVTFITNPYQDQYPTDIASFVGITTNPLYNFQNIYLSMHDPVYIAGYQAFFSQSREQFFGVYPKINSIQSIGTTGDGVTTTFSGTITTQSAILVPGQTQNVSLLQNEVLFDSIDSNNVGLSLVDFPLTDPISGNKVPIGNLYVPNALPTGPLLYPADLLPNNNINYVTGQFTITFPTAPGAGQVINSQSVPSPTQIPQALLYYDDIFTIRPVPDQPYRVQFEAYIRPTELIGSTAVPNLEEWWQYIAYGAAKKIFEDRMDLDSVALIMPEFKKQEMLCQRRTIVQYTNERAATIYTEQVGTQGAGWGWGYGGGPF